MEVEVNYPFLIGKSFVQEDFYGILDIGVNYSFINNSKVKVGASLSSSLLKNKSDYTLLSQPNIDTRIIAHLIQPKIFTSLNLHFVPRIHPFASVGYSFVSFYVTQTDIATGIKGSASGPARRGLNGAFGIAYDLNHQLSLKIQYDYIRYVDGLSTDFKPYNHLSMLKLGIGVNLK